ncbi:hypothetical protein OIU77_005485 [Salix suchowensis]|uniref:Uncharacterized protein n=1 Tax=Salix suchowensis TaxID=1278906 RepID=A0ABQ9ARK0_9ROSI|nr:hypothetical protein OIU77_005485 [Salix suchowensis]
MHVWDYKFPVAFYELLTIKSGYSNTMPTPLTIAEKESPLSGHEGTVSVLPIEGFISGYSCLRFRQL